MIENKLEVLAENYTGNPSFQWVEAGLPVEYNGLTAPVTLAGETQNITGFVHKGLLFFRPALQANRSERFKVDILGKVDTWAQISYSDWITDQLERVVPNWVIQQADGTKTIHPGTLPERIEAGPARDVWRLTQTLPGPIHVVGFFYVYPDQDSVEFEFRFTFGDTTGSGGLYKSFRSLSMIVGEKPVIDSRRMKGLHEPMWRADIKPGQIWWEAELVTPQNWLRGQTFEVQGAMLCLPSEDRFGQLPGNPRVAWLMSRETAAPKAILDRKHWEGKYLAFGTVPEKWDGCEIEQGRRRLDFYARQNIAYGPLAPRPYSQPPSAAQTGEQPDFGASRAEHAIAMGAAWAIRDLRDSVEGWTLRCYGNREPDGMYVTKERHSTAVVTSLRPDERFTNDMLGWPRPVPYFEQWGSSDNEHRSDNLLFGMWLLTRSKSLEMTINDILILQSMDALHLGAPRAVGRVLVSLCHALSCGFTQVRPIIDRIVEMAWNRADYRQRPATTKMKVFSSNEAKYGWLKPDGAAIRCQLPWQESILILGMIAAWRTTGNQKARELAIVLGTTVATYGFFQWNGQWMTAYGIEWNDSGEPPPASAFTPVLPNYQVFTYGMERWMMAPLKFILEQDPTNPVVSKINNIFAAFPVRSWADSCWRAI